MKFIMKKKNNLYIIIKNEKIIQNLILKLEK